MVPRQKFCEGKNHPMHRVKQRLSQNLPVCEKPAVRTESRTVSVF